MCAGLRRGARESSNWRCRRECGGGTTQPSEAAAAAAPPGPYIEGDCDVSSSAVAQVLVGMIQSWAKNLVIDLGFALEPQALDEFPEVCLGAARLSRLDVAAPPLVAAAPSDWVLGKRPGRPGLTHAEKAAAEAAAAAATEDDER